MDECTPLLERRTRNQFQRNVIPSSVLRGPCSNACKLPSLPDRFCNGCLCYFHSQCVGLPGEEPINIFCPDCLRVGRYGKLSPQPIIVEADLQTYIQKKAAPAVHAKSISESPVDVNRSANKTHISCLPVTDANDFLKSPPLNTRFKALPQSVVIIGSRKFLAIPTGSKSEKTNMEDMDPVPEESASSSSHSPIDENEVVYVGDTFHKSTSQTHNPKQSSEINLLKLNPKLSSNSKASAESGQLSLAQPIDLRIQPQLPPIHDLVNGNRAAAPSNVCPLPMDPKHGKSVPTAHDPKAKNSTQDNHKLLYKAKTSKTNHVSPRSSLSCNSASCVDGHSNRPSQYGRKPNVSNHADQIPCGSPILNTSNSQIAQPQQSSQNHASARAAGCSSKTISPKNVMRATVVHASRDNQSRSKQLPSPVSALCRKHLAEYFPRKNYFGNAVQDRRTCCRCGVRSTSQPTVEAFQRTWNPRPSKSTALAQHDFFASNNYNNSNNKKPRESGRGPREQRRKSVAREQPDAIKSFPIKPQNQASDFGSQNAQVRPTTHKKSVEIPCCSKTGVQVNRGTAVTSNSANKSGKYGCSTAKAGCQNFQDPSLSTTAIQGDKESQLRSSATDPGLETMQLSPEQNNAIQELASTIVSHLSLNNMVVNHHVDVAWQSYEKIFEELKKRNLSHLLNDLRNLQYPIEFCREYRNYFTQLIQYSQLAVIQTGVPDDPISSVNQMAVLEPQTLKSMDDSQPNQVQHTGSEPSQAFRQSQAGVIKVEVHMGINQAEINTQVGVDLATAPNNKQSLEPLASSSTYQPSKTSNATFLPRTQYVYPSTRQSYGNFVITYPHHDASNEANIEYDLHQHVPDTIPPISTQPGQVGYMVDRRYNRDFSTPARSYSMPVYQQHQNGTQNHPPAPYQCACYLCIPNPPVRAPPTSCSCPDCVNESWSPILREPKWKMTLPIEMRKRPHSYKNSVQYVTLEITFKTLL